MSNTTSSDDLRFDSPEQAISSRAKDLMAASLFAVWRRTDRLFAILLIIQFVAGVALSIWLTPYTWQGSQEFLHLHVWVATVGGLLTISLPLTLVWFRPGSFLTRQTLAVAQVLFSALLIHLCGGRIEAHFHIFGSLAFLSFYRDWKVLLTAATVVATDHFVRGILWPQSVFGEPTGSLLRVVEHSGWVLFEAVFLIWACRRSVREMREISWQQAELEGTNRRIEQQVQLRTNQLSDAVSSLEKSNTELETFAYVASHDLRSPLRGITSLTTWISEDLEEEAVQLPEIIQGHFDKILEQASRMDALLVGLLEYSRAGRKFGLPENVDTRGLVEQTIQLASLPACFTTTITGVFPVIYAERSPLERVILNLLTNAYKHHDKECGNIEIHGEVVDDQLWFRISDDGPGIPEKNHERIFEIFQTLKARDKVGSASGIGLAIVKKLVESVGGSIEVSCPGERGATFLFPWPLVHPSHLNSTADEVHEPAEMAS